MKLHLLVTGTLILCLSLVAPAQDFVIKTYHVDIQVNEDGFLDVTENIAVEFFEQRRGIFREIPTRYQLAGDQINIRISEVEVAGWEHKVERKGHKFVLRIGSADRFITGPQAYVISYRVTGPFFYWEEWTELYWNVIGPEWQVPIEKASFELRFPSALTAELGDYRVFSGRENDQDNALLVEREGAVLRGETRGTLQPGEGISVAQKITPGVIKESRALTEHETSVRIPDKTYPIPAALLGVLYLFWARFVRREKRNYPREDVHFPPEGLESPVAGAVIDGRVQTRDVISLIPLWGSRGHLRIRSLQSEYGYEKDDLYIERLEDLPGHAPYYQRIFFDKLFEEKDVVLLSSVKEKFYSTIAKVKAELRRDTRANDQWYDRAGSSVYKGGVFIGLFLLCLTISIFVMVKWQLIATGIITLLLGIACLIIHLQPLRMTDEGQYLRHRLKMLRNSLKSTNTDRVTRLVGDDPGYFEKLFPYAVAFGLDRGFIKQFEALQEVAPPWFFNDHSYSNNQPTTFQDFSQQFDVKSVQSAFVSTPPSQSTGSSSGTSFSGGTGGGFGGGGGGSW